MKYLFETHFHTAEVSPCGHVKAATGAAMYKKAGYSGIVVTDHFADRYFKNDFKGDNWREKVDSFLKGYRIAKMQEDAGFSVVLGVELRLDETANDYLLFGVTEDFLYNNEEFYHLSLKELKMLTEKNGIAIVQAHPFRPGMTVSDPKYLDGIEAYNGNRRHNSSNEVAALWAKRFSLFASSGSDFHEKEDFARGGVYFDFAPRDSVELRKAFLSGNYSLKESD